MALDAELAASSELPLRRIHGPAWVMPLRIVSRLLV